MQFYLRYEIFTLFKRLRLRPSQSHPDAMGKFLRRFKFYSFMRPVAHCTEKGKGAKARKPSKLFMFRTRTLSGRFFCRECKEKSSTLPAFAAQHRRWNFFSANGRHYKKNNRRNLGVKGDKGSISLLLRRAFRT